MFYSGMKAQWDEGFGRILLGDNTNGNEVMLRPIGFQCVGIVLLTGLLRVAYMNIS
jgi:hypothetical protein